MQPIQYQYLRVPFASRTTLKEPSLEEGPPLPSTKMLHLIGGLWVSRALYLVARLGIADLLKSGPKHAETLAQATGTQVSVLYRILRALASVGVFAEDDSGCFSLTPLAITL